MTTPQIPALPGCTPLGLPEAHVAKGHTPTPWNVRDCDTYTIRDAQGHEVARVARHEIPVERIKANAALIVRAVNSFDPALLADLRAEITRLNQAAGETVFNPALTQGLNAILKLARGDA